MNAELVDPFATPERLKTADMCEDITARLQRAQYDDAPLYPQVVQKVLHELAREANSARPMWSASAFARDLLEQLHHRAVSGVEYDELQEPAWSLDSERSLRGGDDMAAYPGGRCPNCRSNFVHTANCPRPVPQPAPEHQERS